MFHQVMWFENQTRFAGILQLPKKQVVYLSIQKPLEFDAPFFREEVPCTCLGDAQHETWSKAGGLIPGPFLGSD